MGIFGLNWDLGEINRKRLALVAGVGGLLAVGMAIWAFSGGDGGDKAAPAVDRVVKAEQGRDAAALSAAVADPNPEAARAAIRGLARVSGPASVPRIQTALADARPPVRYQAAIQLGQFGPAARDALPAVRQAAKDSDPSVRAAAAYSLGKFQTVEAVEPLVAGLEDPDPAVRRAAIGSLQDMFKVVYRSYDPDAGQPQRDRAVAEVRKMLPGHILAYNLWQKNLAKAGAGAGAGGGKGPQAGAR